MDNPFRIGTRESRLAVWQASEVQKLLLQSEHHSELVYIKSEGDIDLSTTLYEMGVQGIFTRSLDIALLSGKIDMAVHSMKDVPTQLPKGLVQAAVLKRGPVNDLLVFKHNPEFLNDRSSIAHLATSSIRRRAQWLSRYPNHIMHNLRGNMQTRMQKLHSNTWDGAIFAQAGLERIELRPQNSVELEWMLPAPAQGAVVVITREDNHRALSACDKFNDRNTAMCTHAERSFLRGVLGGCSTPVSALAQIHGNKLKLKANMFSPDGKRKVEVERETLITDAANLGFEAAMEALSNGGDEINRMIREQMGKLTSS